MKGQVLMMIRVFFDSPRARQRPVHLIKEAPSAVASLKSLEEAGLDAFRGRINVFLVVNFHDRTIH